MRSIGCSNSGGEGKFEGSHSGVAADSSLQWMLFHIDGKIVAGIWTEISGCTAWTCGRTAVK